MKIKYRNLLFITILLQQITSVVPNRTSDNKTDPSKVLSRRKRWLIFPDGSSLQLVFCLQTAALIQIGDIFLIGNTVALAWNLPTDPEFLTMFNGHEKYQRRQDINEIYYLDEQGKVLAKVPYKRKPIINPAFAKRSIQEENKTTFKEKLKIKLDRIQMHEKQKTREYLKQEHMNEKSIEFHRSSRVGLYEKLEKLFTALGRDGRQCVLHKLCESSRSSAQGTFLQELLRVVFTIPKGTEFENEDHREYDTAHHSNFEDCSAKYPGCDSFDIPDQV